MVTVIGLGVLCSSGFHAGLREVHAGIEDTASLITRRKSWSGVIG